MKSLPHIPRGARPALISAGAVSIAGMVTLPQFEIGALSLHMVQHLVIMNVAAPVAAVVLAPFVSLGTRRPALLWTSGFLQMALLWAFHVPSVQQAAAGSTTLHLAMLTLLALASLLFWLMLVECVAKERWRGVAVLLLTGKLACLLGGLLVFAPRELYGLPAFSSILCSVGPSTLADQQLAGLLMITACPLSYVVAGTVLTAQMMIDLERGSPAAMRARSHAASG